MVSAVGPQQNIITKTRDFYSTPELEKEIRDSHAHVVSGSPLNQSRIVMEKFQNAITLYPIRGMKGSVNSNFYEFLTMGMVPYIIGSGMMIAVFNGVTKHFEPNQAKHASSIGRKMALGVLFYGALKSLSKKFIEVPVYLKTGVDVNMPYKDMKTPLPEKPGEDALDKRNEYHQVFESVDFPRWDLLYDMKKGKPRNYYYDKVAKRMGLGKDLADSDQEAKPKIKEMIIRTKTWTTLSSYLWAGLGVALAVQDGWDKAFVKNNSEVKIFSRQFAKDLKDGFKESCKQLWNGGVNKSPTRAAAGKAFVLAAATSTVLGAFMSTFNFFNKQADLKDGKIDYDKDYTVG